MKKLLFAGISTVLLCACAANEPLVTDEPLSPSWVTLQTGTGSNGMPITTVMLVLNDINKPIYGADCEGIVSPIEIGGAETSVRCWWAGGGADFAAFKTGTGYIVRTRWVDEESGFGPWEKAF